MLFRQKSIYFLSSIALLLIGIILYLGLTSNKEKPEVPYYKEPYIHFIDEIRFEFDPEYTITVNDILDQILIPEQSDYDEIIDIEIDLGAIGTKRGNVMARRGDVIATRSFTYHVVDLVPPVLYLDKPIVLNLGQELDLSQFVRIEDNSLQEDVSLTPRIVGDYDINRVGVYSVVIEAEDESGNQGSFTTTITVVGYQSSITPQKPSQPNAPQDQTPPLVEQPEEVDPNPPEEVGDVGNGSDTNGDNDSDTSNEEIND